jgi:hypothetical protein
MIDISAEGDAGRYISDSTVQRKFDIIKHVEKKGTMDAYVILLTKTKGMAGCIFHLFVKKMELRFIMLHVWLILNIH